MDTDQLIPLSAFESEELSKGLFASLIRNHQMKWLVQYAGLVTPIEPYGQAIGDNFYVTGLSYAFTYSAQVDAKKSSDTCSIEIQHIAPSIMTTIPEHVDLANFEEGEFAFQVEAPIVLDPFKKGQLLPKDLASAFEAIRLPQPPAAIAASPLENKERENLLRTISLMARLLQKADQQYTKAQGQAQNPSSIAQAVENEAIALGEIDGQKKRTIEDRIAKGNTLLP